MLKFLIIFVCGLVETWLYAWYLLEINRHRAIRSSLVLVIQMALYLAILSYVIKDINTIWLIADYCLGCGIGNYIKLRTDNKRRLK